MTSARSGALAVAAAIVFASGIWLTRAGRPYSAVLLNVHKLVDLAAVLVVGIAAYQANRATPLSATEWLVIVVTGVLVVTTFASGGLISGMSEPPTAALWLHRVVSWVVGALGALSVYFLALRS